MGMMKFEVSHTLPRDEAKKRIQTLLDHWRTKYGVKTDWEGEQARVTGKVMGIQLDANFQVTDRAVAGEGTDPGLLLRTQAKSYLQRKFGAVLDPAHDPKTLREDGKTSRVSCMVAWVRASVSSSSASADSRPNHAPSRQVSALAKAMLNGIPMMGMEPTSLSHSRSWARKPRLGFR